MLILLHRAYHISTVVCNVSAISVNKFKSKRADTKCDDKYVIEAPKACENAAIQLNKQWQGEVDDSNYPRGCYLNNDINGTNGVYFNNNNLGDYHPKAEPICYTDKCK